MPVITATTNQVSEDPVVSWYLCTAPDWGCEAMDVPDQPRSEIPLMANFWTYTAIADVVTTTSSSAANAPVEESTE